MKTMVKSTPTLLVVFCFLTTQCWSVADGPFNGSKQLIVREVCTFSDNERYRQNGSLTFDGKDLIIVIPGKKLSLFSVKDLTERVVSENPMIAHAWSDAATGCVFVVMKSEKIGSKDEGKRHLEFLDLLLLQQHKRFVELETQMDEEEAPTQ